MISENLFNVQSSSPSILHELHRVLGRDFNGDLFNDWATREAYAVDASIYRIAPLAVARQHGQSLHIAECLAQILFPTLPS